MSDQPVMKKPLWRRVLRWLFYAAVGLVVVAVVVWAVWENVATRQLRAEIEKIRAAGEPLTFDELDAMLPKIDPADDAAPYYAAGIALLKSSDVVGDLLGDYRDALRNQPAGQLADDRREQASRLLEENKLALELLDKGGCLPECRYDLHIKYGIAACMETLAQTRAAARLLSLRTREFALSGNGDEAVDSLISGFQIARMPERQPVLISYMVRVACVFLACFDVKTVLEYGQPSDESLVKLHDTLSAAYRPAELERMLLTERVYFLNVMSNIIAGSVPRGVFGERFTPVPERWPGNLRAVPWARSYAVGVLRDMARTMEETRKPWPAAIDSFKGGPKEGYIKIISWMPSSVVAMRRAFETMGRAIANVRCTTIAVMIERYHRAQGKLPNELSDLVPQFVDALPLDPFTGEDLIYRQDENEYVVYSVGKNLKNDGGVFKVEDGKYLDWGVRIRNLTAK